MERDCYNYGQVVPESTNEGSGRGARTDRQTFDNVAECVVVCGRCCQPTSCSVVAQGMQGWIGERSHGVTVTNNKPSNAERTKALSHTIIIVSTTRPPTFPVSSQPLHSRSTLSTNILLFYKSVYIQFHYQYKSTYIFVINEDLIPDSHSHWIPDSRIQDSEYQNTGS